MQTILSSYESLRSALSEDEFEGLDTHVASIEKAAHSLAAAGKSDWTKVETAAQHFKRSLKSEVRLVRKSSGDLSEPLLNILAKDKGLAKGLHVFECPMAEGYKKWAQPTSEISNPYRGTKMPKCGAESEF